ncbi:MAG TPA: GNAT family N-acetyltransferase, partial [Saprospiraceae bacterium]|nr:GNAT family N-acetyltransferase [Saprospiraceae bacterium]
MEASNLSVRLIDKTYVEQAVPILAQLNKTISHELIAARFEAMFGYDQYICFGLFDDDQFVGLCGAWTTTRVYCGKQLELDNLVIDQNVRSKGYGKFLFEHIDKWCLERGYETIELNTYVQNAASHKFYFNLDYKILGFHFQKILG